jgi:hypothetical protein
MTPMALSFCMEREVRSLRLPSASAISLCDTRMKFSKSRCKSQIVKHAQVNGVEIPLALHFL